MIRRIRNSHRARVFTASMQQAMMTRPDPHAAMRAVVDEWAEKERLRMERWWATPMGWRRYIKFWLGA